MIEDDDGQEGEEGKERLDKDQKGEALTGPSNEQLHIQSACQLLSALEMTCWLTQPIEKKYNRFRPAPFEALPGND